MPNWCANSLKLTPTTEANKELIAKVIKAIDDTEGTNDSPRIFNILKPMPEELRDTVKGFTNDAEQQALHQAKSAICKVKYGYTDWYEWSLGEWGTKWDACEVFHSVEPDGSLLLEFDTAWSPPVNLYITLEEMGFQVSAGFVEQGASYVGYYANGVDHTENIAYDSNSEDEEDEYREPFNLSDFFSKNYGLDHAPSHFGG